MNLRFIAYTYATVASLVLMLLTFWLQTYHFTALEEEYIFLYDADYISGLWHEPGGGAQLVASWLSQHFIHRWIGSLVTGVLYAVIIFSLCAIGIRRRASALSMSLSALPAFCLLLCFENTAFEYQGVVAVMLCVVALWVYACISDAVSVRHRATVRVGVGVLLAVTMYWWAGSAAIITAVGAMIYDMVSRRRLWYADVLYVAAFFITGYLSYICGALPTIQQAFTPAMYYDMGSTYFMMIYAMVAIAIYMIVIAFRGNTRWSVASCALVLILLIGASMNIYGKVHSVKNYENRQQRYYARHQMWDEIIDMPYHGDATPYTSYRFLALAHKGMLADRLMDYRPHISYIFENKPKVKKMDQQIYSDIYFDCRYMAAARRSAFDTDIVTPGAFNPYETQKLAVINLAYGDTAVAKKHLLRLKKTRYYSEWAQRYLDLIDNGGDDECISLLREAIPDTDGYLSPKGMMRDLKYLHDTQGGVGVASQFYKAFLILTHQ